MSANAYRLRVGLFAAATVLVSVNALALWGQGVARWGELALRSIVGLGALVCAVVTARQVSGIARWWRLLVVAAFVSWLVAELLWWSTGTALTGGIAPPVAVAAYFLPPLASFAAMLLLVRASSGVTGQPDGMSRGDSPVIAVLDGLVAAIAFALLVLIAGFGALTGNSLPRSGSAAVVIAYAALELIVVVAAELMGLAYRPDRPYRSTYLLLAGGVVVLASSDRMVAYFQNVGVERGELWGGIGFVLGPLLIAYSLLDLSPRQKPDTARGHDAMDWAQLVLPYVGFTGIALLMAYHVLIGQKLTPVVIAGALVVVVLIAARQVVAMRAQRLLTLRLFEAQSRLAHQVHHDALTGLPNRLLFAQRLDEAIHEGPFVLIFVDLDDFKDVNDRFGHAAGDELLRAVGQRLQGCVGDSDTLARIGGDEFAILVDGELEAPEVVADRIRVALRDPFAIHGSSVRVRASMGLVRPDADEPTPTSDDLLRRADVSMYAGKRVGKDTAVVYRPSLGVSTDFVTALRQADGGIPPGFSLVYQPVVRLPDETPVAVEALARWTAPDGTEIPPETFVAAAEAAGLGATVDGLVLDLACRDVEAAGLDLPVHVNVSAARLGSLEFEQQLQHTLMRCGMTPSQLVIEVTETVPIVDLADAAAQIVRLRAMGITVALDDFGAGHNSLTYLHVLPVQIIKLDRSLAIAGRPGGRLTLYRSVIRLCAALGLGVIAEGIESIDQAETVFAAGCRLAQGHLFGRPSALADIDWSASVRESPVRQTLFSPGPG
ncbi:MAG: diguanylate cyclase [Mycobacterium sp.]|nr:diguanylate cyclase [Mycobacterium sp.]